MSNNLIECYRSIINAAGLQVKGDGDVYKEDDRYFVKGKPLVLPTNEMLRSASIGEKLVFHPFSEAAAKGESDVVEDLRGRFAFRLNLNVSKLIGFFLKIGTGATQVILDPEQIKVMTAMKLVGEKEARDILAILKATAKGEGKKTPVIKLYLSRRPNSVGKTKYYRTCVVTFPLYQAAKEELVSKTKEYQLIGVPCNKKALESLCKLIEFIFPGIDSDSEAYNVGSTSQIAPFADALCRGVGGLMAIINEKVSLYKEIGEVNALQLPTSWLDGVEELDSMFTEISRIPLQPNADGKARVADIQAADMAVRPPEQPTATVGMGSVGVSQPTMNTPTAHQAQVAVPATPEPEYITTPTGVRKNPRYMQTALFNRGMVSTNKLDPYGVGLMMPNNTTMVQNNQNGFGGFQQPGGFGTPGGKLPGLSF